MGMIMVKCPQTGRAIPTNIRSDREAFLRSVVFYRLPSLSRQSQLVRSRGPGR